MANETSVECDVDYRLIMRLTICTLITGPVCLAGIVTNTMSYLILRSESCARATVVSAGIYLLKVLALADNAFLVYSLGVLSIWHGLMPALDRYRDIGGPAYYDSWPYLITIVHPTGPLLQTFVIWITVLLALNRYVAVCHPLMSGIICTLFKTKIQVAVVVLAAVLFTTPTYFQWWLIHGTSYNNQTGHNETFVNYAHTAINLESLHLYHEKIFSAILIHILPLIMLLYMNTKIYMGMRALRGRNQEQNVVQSTEMRSAERNLSRVMVMVIIVFIVCQLPDRLFLVIDPNRGGEGCLGIFFAAICDLLLVVNSSTNFIIYYFIRKHFREVFIKKYCVCNRTDGLDRITSMSTGTTNI